MKFALVIPDGCADERQPSLNGKTPLQAAHVPRMDQIARLGVVGQADHVPLPMPSGSDVGTMSLFGYDPRVFHTGRAPIEAAAQGITLGPDDWAVRCNFVTAIDGVMRSFTAGQIPNEVGADLIRALQSDPARLPVWEYFQGVSYRNLLIYRGQPGEASPFDSTTTSTPPHDITDQPIEPHLPAGLGSDLLKQMMVGSQDIFRRCPSNAARGAQAATQTWLWGLGKRPSFPLFQERFGKRGAVITAVDLLRGMGRLVGFDVIEVEGATGYLDTDYAAKGRAAISTLKDGADFIVVHVEATDEASHEGHVSEKVKALEQIDSQIVAPLHDYLQSQGDYRILVCPDHPTFLRTKTHSHGYVPFAMCGTGLSADAVTTYDEIAAQSSSVVLTSGSDLMPLFFQGT